MTENTTVIICRYIQLNKQSTRRLLCLLMLKLLMLSKMTVLRSCIDTLSAFTHEAESKVFCKVNEVLRRLNHDHPRMAVGLINHLNPRDKKALGGVRVLTCVRAHIKLFRTEDQMKAIPKDRLPLLSDPFTVSIEKASNNKIAVDGETFAVRFDEKKKTFVVAEQEDPETVRARRKAIVEGYAKQGLTQPEIARLFGVTDKTIRNWISKSE